MPRTTKSDVLIPEIFTDAVQGAFAQRKVFDNASILARTGAVVTSDSFDGDNEMVGNEVEVPYFGTLGEFQQNLADGTPLTPQKLAQTGETATVTRDAEAARRWLSGLVEKGVGRTAPGVVYSSRASRKHGLSVDDGDAR